MPFTLERISKPGGRRSCGAGTLDTDGSAGASPSQKQVLQLVLEWHSSPSCEAAITVRRTVPQSLLHTTELNVIERQDGITQVALSGQLDAAGLHKVDVAFHECTAGARQPAIVDMSDVAFIASLGMGMLLSCAKSLELKGAKMVLLNPQGMVDNVLRVAGIDTAIPIAKSLEEAESLVQQSGSQSG